MKDTTHHLKYLQKKVIQSTRKEQAEGSLNTNIDNNFADSKESDVSLNSVKKKTDF